MTTTVQAWPPTRYTKPLTPDFESAADKLIPALQFAWKLAMGYSLDYFQIQLVRSILEIYPGWHPKAGKLRFRQVLVSVGRQNGKTEIAAFLGLLIMLLKAAGLVIGIASSAEQARLVYQRTMQVIRGNKALVKRFARLTDTRGIETKTGGRYEIKAAKGAALQGLPIDLGIVDEVHLLDFDLWTSLVNGTGGRDNCLVVGITTAGDDESELLKHLYSLEESGETFGFFLWEAPEAMVPEDDETLGEYLAAANPLLASRPEQLANVIPDVRSMPAQDVIRYRLNRFVASQGEFIPVSMWKQCEVQVLPEVEGRNVVFALDVSPGWEYASITASWKVDQLIYTELVVSMPKPTPESLATILLELAQRHSPKKVVMDGYRLKSVGNDLKLKGVPVWFATLAEIGSASALFYARTMRKTVKHPGDALLYQQLPSTRRKNVGDGFKIVRASTLSYIDGVYATAIGIYFAETLPDVDSQLFV